MNNEELINSLQKDFEIGLAEKISAEEIRGSLADYINHLIIHDFNKLVSLLYRVDVNEAKLKHLLKENPGSDAGNIIADMVIERQLQKLKSRQQFRQRDKSIDDEDNW